MSGSIDRLGARFEQLGEELDGFVKKPIIYRKIGDEFVERHQTVMKTSLSSEALSCYSAEV